MLNKLAKLTVLSFGAGQDSTAILYRLIYEPFFKKTYAPGDLIVVMADTGNEHPKTIAHRKWVQTLCAKKKIPFYFITGDMGHTSPSWSKGLKGFYRSANAIGSKAFPKTCTDKLKITPIYNWLEQYVHTTYSTEKVGLKRALQEFAKKYGKIDMLLGIAAGEEKRASTNEDSIAIWMRLAINKVYPLIDLGLDRQACQDYIKSTGWTVPPPSNCMICPFMSLQELLYLWRVWPFEYEEWVELEVNKIKANAYKGDLTKAVSQKTGKIVDNLGVWGKKLLPEMLIIAEEKYGHMTIEELEDYKMSHGHCVKNKF
jgi:3'-phosphoadenosine 5'-phosphosulfate sulfotransferase (PAPS reductase)/FAD synthetase